ncbi:BolA family iron metabolism protein IbaG [Thaumasiovibrio subtropicus]|uniref:BolA family iron metabolism protein IbaG n=1 Tax=Thaumasiovibrio subtropicus TaxID=1891207 RepID=UPI000B35FE49|nr:BolA family iron metabolism protein IbaG [Thaumasiovibrio subtropicus]
METAQIEQILQDALKLDEVIVKGDGSHYEVIAVSEIFDGMSRVKKQQTIYAPLMEHIASNAIHALSIKAFTPDEWARNKKLMSLS